VVTINRPCRRIKLLTEKGFRLKEYSPEKAGVGGSTPSLATKSCQSNRLLLIINPLHLLGIS
jgi:hypothetical protein